MMKIFQKRHFRWKKNNKSRDKSKSKTSINSL